MLVLSIILGLLFVLLLLVIFNPRRYSPAVIKYTVIIPGLPARFHGFSILQLTDLHSKRFGPRQLHLVRAIRAHRYNIVALTGDFINKYNPDPEPFFELMEQLQGKPAYFVPGNHEWNTGFKYRNRLAAAGIRILENEAEKIYIGQEFIWLAGVDDPHLGRARLAKALQKTDNETPRVLLAHSPTIFPEAAAGGVDLVLSGHTHGGQVRLPGIGALLVPGQGLFPKWDYGLYQNRGTTMIVSGGLGESDLPIRFNIHPEVVLIELRQAPD